MRHDVQRAWWSLSSRCRDRRHLSRIAMLQPPSAELNAISLGPAQTGHDPLADHRPLELGKYAQHLEHGAAGRRRCIEALLMQGQVDASWRGVLAGSPGRSARGPGDRPTRPQPCRRRNLHRSSGQCRCSAIRNPSPECDKGLGAMCS
jgi:hypothetical protein